MLVLFLFAVPVVAAACEDEETAGPETGVDVQDVAIDDAEYGIYEGDELVDFDDQNLVGKTVTVSAKISRIVEPGKAIAIGDDVVEGGLLVVMPPKLTDVPTLNTGMAIQVVGTVVDFVVADIEADYGAFDLNGGLYTDWENENVLVARSISPAPPEDAADTPAQ